MFKIRKIWQLILLVILVAVGSSVVTLVVLNSQQVVKPKNNWTKIDTHTFTDGELPAKLEDTKPALSNPYRLHRKEGGIWKEAGIVADYVEWKITSQECEGKNGIQEILVVWRAKFTNISDKKKSISITFELYDRDNFLIAWDEKKFFTDLVRDEKKREEIKNKSLEFISDPDPIMQGVGRLLYKSPYTLSPKEEEVIEGEFWVPKERALSAYKCEIKLGAKEVNE